MRSVLVVIAPPRVAHSGLCKIPEGSRFQWSCLVVVPLTSWVSVAGSEQIQKFQDALCGGLGVGSQFPGRHIAVVEVGCGAVLPNRSVSARRCRLGRRQGGGLSF